MSTFLFSDIIFGPVQSRRLGVSLGINLLPSNKKYCNFNCIYCECGWSHIHKIEADDLPSRSEIREALIKKLIEMRKENRIPDAITYAGNGEPTMHPDFPGIIDDSIEARDEYCPEAEIVVLTNSSLIHKKSIADALIKVDQNILKLDTVYQNTYEILNDPVSKVHINTIIDRLIKLPGKKIIQTLFIRGIFNGISIDNTTEEELSGLIEAYKKIKPEKVMVYTYARDTAAENLKKVPPEELNAIARRINEAGIDTEVSA